MPNTEQSIENTGGVPVIEVEVEVFGMAMYPTDKSLSIADMPADAKATGDAISGVHDDIADILVDISDLREETGADIPLNNNPDAPSIEQAVDSKLDKPVEISAGKFMQTDSNGDAVWGDAASPTDIANAVTDWLDDNVPTGQTVAVDQSLTISGAAADAKKTGDLISDLQDTLGGLVSLSQIGSSDDYKLVINVV